MAGNKSRIVKVTVAGDAKSVRKAFGSAGGAAQKFGNTLKTVVGVAGIAGMIMALKRMGTASIGAAREFEASMAKIVGLVGISRDQVGKWADDIKALGPEVGKAPQELADAMFFITSAGLRGADALAALNASARASAAGLGETKDVAFAAVSAVNSYGAENISASQAVDILTNTVRQGNVEAGEVAGVLGNVIPVASALGVSFDQVGASIAAMTRLGLNAATASTALTGVFRVFLKPSSEATEILGKFGLSAEKLRSEVKEKGLLTVLTKLKETFKGNEDELFKVFGRIQGLTGLLALTGKNAGATGDIFAALADSTGITDEAFAAMAETADFKLKQAMSQLQTIGVAVGSKILPDIVSAVQDFMPALAELLPAFGEMVTTLLHLAKTVMPAVIWAAGQLTRVVGEMDLVISGINGIWDENVKVTHRVDTAIRDMIVSVKDGEDPVYALARGMNKLSMGGHLTAEAVTALGQASGLTNTDIADAIQQVIVWTTNINAADPALKNLTASLTEKVIVLKEEGALTDEQIKATYGAAVAAGVQRDAERENAKAMWEAVAAAKEGATATGAVDEASAGYEEQIVSLTDNLHLAIDGQLGLTSAIKAATDPVFGAISAYQNYKKALATRDKMVKEGKSSSEELALQEVEIAKQAVAAQLALDNVSEDALTAAMEGIALATGKTTDQVEELLTATGLLDGQVVRQVIETEHVDLYKQGIGSKPIPRGFSRGEITPPMFAGGGVFRTTPPGAAGLAILHDEELVVSRKQAVSQQAGAAGGSGITVQNMNITIQDDLRDPGAGRRFVRRLAKDLENYNRERV